jgi:putative membrane protein
MRDVLLASGEWPRHGWFLLFPLVWITLIALLVRFAFMRGGFEHALVRALGAGWGFGRRNGPWPDRARGILAERYARGEIGEDEYRSRLERLRAEAQT